MDSFFYKISRQPYFIFLILFLVSGLISIASLRHNNTTMIELRNDVYAADRANGNVDAALNKLRAYVYGHMNTDLSTGISVKPPVQLQYTYERLVSEAEKNANKASLYTEAENYCQALIPASVSVSGRGRVSCVQDYIMAHGGSAPASIPVSLYEFDFISPSWSPDLAGWSLVVTVLSGLAFIASFLLVRFTNIKFPVL
jgi:hypothetical protein